MNKNVISIKIYLLASLFFLLRSTLLLCNAQSNKEDKPFISVKYQSSTEVKEKAINLNYDCESLLPEVKNNPPAPKPEPIKVSELPLPPTVGTINLHGTGFIDASDKAIEEGPAYMWDGKHVLLTVNFAGAPPAPDPASIYSGMQVIIIKTDGTTFSNGDPWKCLTCGIPEANKPGMNKTLDHPQAFHDGKRIIAGNNVIECSELLASDQCKPENTHVYPIRWNKNADGSGEGGSIREVRLNPDDVHIGWSYMGMVGGSFTQLPFMGRLVFNQSPSNGIPLVPRYELDKVNVLLNTSPDFQFFMVNPENPKELLHNKPKGVIGEFRGWTSDGQSTLGIYMEESCNWDGYVTSLATGESRRITRDPAYTDPMKSSPDDNWTIVMDSRGYDRMMWIAGMKGIPPLTDFLTMMITTSVRNNGNRRFFQPYLIDRFGDRSSYHGQQINAGDETPGSASDPNWNGRADPAWSPDGTKVIYWQALVTSPDCGGNNPLPCPASTEPGGRKVRLMISHLTGRKPMPVKKVAPISDYVPWAKLYNPGDVLQSLTYSIPGGTFVLKGKVSGSADVVLVKSPEGRGFSSVSVSYTNFTDDGQRIINGTESVEMKFNGKAISTIWHSNLTSSGCQTGTKITSEPEGFKVEGGSILGGGNRTGKLTTTVGGKTYISPPAGT